MAPAMSTFPAKLTTAALTLAPALRVYVPAEPLNISVLPAALKGPLLEPPPRLNAPLVTSIVPVLLNATPLKVVVPAPADFLKRPALLKAGVPPKLSIKKSDWPSQVAPARLLKTAPLARKKRPLLVIVAVAALLKTRPEFSPMLPKLPLAMLAPPLALVAPAPVICPSLQVSNPAMVTPPVPESVPTLCVNALLMTDVPLSVSVPPLMVTAPSLVKVPATVSEPPEKTRLPLLPRELILCAPEESVTVTGVGIHTSSPGPGNEP